MNIKNVMVAGAGTLGSQIAWQTAFKGFNVIVYDAFEDGLAQGKKFHEQFALLFSKERGATQTEINATLARISYTTDLSEAVKNADIVSESVPESIEIKAKFYTELGKLAPERTIFTTNTSTLLPSQFAEFTGRPEKFLALHFANGIWDANIGEVMGHAGTDAKVFNEIVQFAKDIGMVAIPIHKEQHGYIINSLLTVWGNAAIDLVRSGVATPEDVDKTWMIAAQAPVGPFGIFDVVGMRTAYNINKLWGEQLNDEEALARADFIDKEFIEKGRIGAESGEGVYKYPNPAYQQDGFLK